MGDTVIARADKSPFILVIPLCLLGIIGSATCTWKHHAVNAEYRNLYERFLANLRHWQDTVARDRYVQFKKLGCLAHEMTCKITFGYDPMKDEELDEAL